MTIRVNDETRSVSEPLTLLALLHELGLAERLGVAAALNGTVVPRGKWADSMLKEADKVLLIHATQGG